MEIQLRSEWGLVWGAISQFRPFLEAVIQYVRLSPDSINYGYKAVQKNSFSLKVLLVSLKHSVSFIVRFII